MKYFVDMLFDLWTKTQRHQTIYTEYIGISITFHDNSNFKCHPIIPFRRMQFCFGMWRILEHREG